MEFLVPGKLTVAKIIIQWVVTKLLSSSLRYAWDCSIFSGTRTVTEAEVREHMALIDLHRFETLVHLHLNMLREIDNSSTSPTQKSTLSDENWKFIDNYFHEG